jgi:hypothetical protein
MSSSNPPMIHNDHRDEKDGRDCTSQHSSYHWTTVERDADRQGNHQCDTCDGQDLRHLPKGHVGVVIRHGRRLEERL